MKRRMNPWVLGVLAAVAFGLVLVSAACVTVLVLRTLEGRRVADVRLEATREPLPLATVAPVSLPALGFRNDGSASNLYIEYILDASGSMMGQLPDGTTKREAAREVLVAHMRSFPAATAIGFRAYGHRMPWQGQEAASCQDIELVAPVETGHTATIAGWLRDFTAQGMTPLELSIRQAMGDFRGDAERVNSIIMVSDGQETCGGDPCAAVAELKQRGIAFTLYVVGLDVDAEARTQLTCIAREGGGRYYDAATAEELAAALGAIGEEIVSRLPEAGPAPTREPEAGVQLSGPEQLMMDFLAVLNDPELEKVASFISQDGDTWWGPGFSEGGPIAASDLAREITNSALRSNGIGCVGYEIDPDGQLWLVTDGHQFGDDLTEKADVLKLGFKPAGTGYKLTAVILYFYAGGWADLIEQGVLPGLTSCPAGAPPPRTVR